MFRLTYPMVMAVALLALSLRVQAEELTSGTRIESPDRKFIVECKIGEQVSPHVGEIDIINATSGRLERSFEIDPPLFALKWTGDSKTFVVVEHVARGSIAQVIHRDLEGWNAFQAEPRQSGEGYVVSLAPKMNSCKIAYKINERPGEGCLGRLLLTAFVIDPATGLRRDEKTCEIDTERYRRLRLE